MRVPAPAASRAVLIGVGSYTHPDLAPLPAAETGASRLATLLGDPTIWGLPAGHVSVLPADATAEDVLGAVRDAAQGATDSLVVYFAGHGLRDREERLFLALKGADADYPQIGTLSYRVLRDVLRQVGYRARRRVTVLDCCYSGLAGSMSATGDPTRSELARALDEPERTDGAPIMGPTVGITGHEDDYGDCILTSAPPTQRSFATPGAPFPDFTGELIDVLEHGITNAGETISLDDVWRRARNRLRERGSPEPQQFTQNAVARHIRLRNRSHGQEVRTLESRFHGAQELGRAGDPAGAVAGFSDLVVDLERVLGPDHHTTLVGRYELALWRGRAGDPAAAVHGLTEVVRDLKGALGDDDAETLTGRQSLALWRHIAGDAAGAAADFADLVPALQRVLGPDHPDTLTSRQNLVSLRGEHDPAAALVDLADLVPVLQRVLGPDHPDTLTSRQNLAVLRGEAGDPVAAVRELAEVLSARRKALGSDGPDDPDHPDDPDTLTNRFMLARWRGKAGDPAAAVRVLAEVLSDRQRVLGPDHRGTLTNRQELALWRGEAGDPAAAVRELAEVLSDRRRVLGPDHRDTLINRHELARWRGMAGDPAAAAEEFAALLADVERVLGPNSPTTLTTRHELARWRGEAGDPAAAVRGLAEVLSVRLRVLGPDHRDTLTNWYELARWGVEQWPASRSGFERGAPSLVRAIAVGADWR
ncbi:tetratricopeptide repeat protein [Streptomyces piniterrae]|uniref:Tetratricopeptide repeat protein n=1 Tax=Streptomyces piniterrae TaxID=2571125 RepID=A0A4U0NQQ9_9ACTN|nr:tetratricopeptide repeat protein [Streptomyces piniterrae]TJZ56911.1 tetratricopeptide repeat protein [Streptomyces piniterrae]